MQPARAKEVQATTLQGSPRRYLQNIPELLHTHISTKKMKTKKIDKIQKPKTLKNFKEMPCTKPCMLPLLCLSYPSGNRTAAHSTLFVGLSKKTPAVGKVRTDGQGPHNKLKDSIAKPRGSPIAGRVGTPGMTRAKAND
ncbi:Ribosome-binding factor [Trichinella spiralis]|uniref:Ribosome-binding factor n=1 Tax=Trichinella spiralis TaxID=6334 RepID=A0ABR3KMD3_TRISP